MPKKTAKIPPSPEFLGHEVPKGVRYAAAGRGGERAEIRATRGIRTCRESRYALNEQVLSPYSVAVCSASEKGWGGPLAAKRRPLAWHTWSVTRLNQGGQNCGLLPVVGGLVFMGIRPVFPGFSRAFARGWLAFSRPITLITPIPLRGKVETFYLWEPHKEGDAPWRKPLPQKRRRRRLRS